MVAHHPFYFLVVFLFQLKENLNKIKERRGKVNKKANYDLRHECQKDDKEKGIHIFTKKKKLKIRWV